GRANFSVGDTRATHLHYLPRRYTLQAQAAWQLNERLGFNGALTWQDYKRRPQTTIRDFRDHTETPSADAGAQDISRFNTLFFRGTAQYKISPEVTVQLGIELRRDASSGQRIEGEPAISDYAGFVSAEIRPVTWMNIRPGIRFSKNSVYDAPPAIPSINAKFSLNKHMDLRLSYGRGFRAPALRELYFYFFDASHSIKGNADLKAEYSHSINGSLSWQATGHAALRYTLALSGFYNHFDNLIDI